jgi:wyosine [tRNA(Phe)-imidazoG37] synthetase (radical SAM superfamily)
VKVFGPVPSRRLGQSLGINNIPPKICSYSCNYCQVGKSLKISIKRVHYYAPETLVETVLMKVNKAKEYHERIDYLTFVPDGEPTLDINLGKEIAMLKILGIKIAVITNGSLLGREDVRNDLKMADLVSIKMDASDEQTWGKINHPHRELDFTSVWDGMMAFSKQYKGRLISETMLIKDGNDSVNHINGLAELVAQLNPDTAYISIPVRPPAFENVEPADENTLNLCYQLYAGKLPNVEYLIGYEGNAFAYTGDVEEDILSITAVHPMREDAVAELLKKSHSDNKVLEALIDSGKIIETQYKKNKFYMRKLKSGLTI